MNHHTNPAEACTREDHAFNVCPSCGCEMPPEARPGAECFDCWSAGKHEVRIVATSRSNRREIRNPVLALPAFAQVRALPLEARLALRAVLREIGSQAREKAEKSWRTHKAPMAAYWKAVSTYAGHTAKAISSTTKESDK